MQPFETLSYEQLILNGKLLPCVYGATLCFWSLLFRHYQIIKTLWEPLYYLRYNFNFSISINCSLISIHYNLWMIFKYKWFIFLSKEFITNILNSKKPGPQSISLLRWHSILETECHYNQNTLHLKKALFYQTYFCKYVCIHLFSWYSCTIWILERRHLISYSAYVAYIMLSDIQVLLTNLFCEL